MELEDRINKTKASIKFKKLQIKSAKKKANFRGVRISDQFNVGRSGIKQFRATRKLERKSSLVDLGIFSGEMVGLKSSLEVDKKDLFDFNNGMVEL